MPGPDESERQDDLDATAESLRDDAQRVVEIEDRKKDLEVGDPKVDVLSNEAERLAGQIQRKSRIERQLSDAEPADGSDAGQRPN